MAQSNTPSVKTVRVLLLRFDHVQLAIFRMAFKMHSVTNYQVIQEGSNISPDLVVVDGDAGLTAQEWESLRKEHFSSKVVYYSRQQPSFSAPYLAKPVRFDTLFVHLRTLLQGGGVVGAADAAKRDIPTSQASSKEAPTEEIQSKAPSSVQIEYFQLQGSLLGLVQDIAERRVSTVVYADDKPLFTVSPNMMDVFVHVDLDDIKEHCQEHPSTSFRTEEAGDEVVADIKSSLKIKAFLWQIAAWSVKGKLIHPISVNTVIKLKSWPNMTRIAQLPEAIRISAFLSKTSATLTSLCRVLPVDVKDTLNFIAAAYVAGHLQIQQSSGQDARAPSTLLQPTRSNTDEKKSRGMLQRLMDRIRGR